MADQPFAKTASFFEKLTCKGNLFSGIVNWFGSICCIDHGQALLLDSDLAPLFQFKRTSWGLLLGTQITPRGWIFWTIIFYHQKI